MPRSAKALADELEGVWARADREGRDLTPDERSRVEELIDATKSQHRVEQEIQSLSKSLGAPLMDSLGANGSWEKTARENASRGHVAA